MSDELRFLSIAKLKTEGGENRLKPIATIKTGELVAFSTGEYSDHSVMVLLRAKSDFTNDDMLCAVEDSKCMYISKTYTWFDGTWSESILRFDEDKLIAYLAGLDCFEEVQAREIHLGDYGRFEIADWGNLAHGFRD